MFDKLTNKAIEAMSGENPNKYNRYVKLNVGGRLFVSSIDTLTKQDNMLRAMFSGNIQGQYHLL